MIHWNICKNYHITTTNNRWEHIVDKVVENENVKILWDFRLQTDKILAHNTPDLTVIEKKKVWLIDIAIPGDSRVEEKELEKITRYQDLKSKSNDYDANQQWWFQLLSAHWVPYQKTLVST